MTSFQVISREKILGAGSDAGLIFLDGLKELTMTFDDEISIEEAAEMMMDVIIKKSPNNRFERFTCKKV
ncbi:MAG: hypothetical protein IKR53_05520 [Clostridia bacterium]|nr:hypothetical protein [Clostridia bacterium]MBR6290885.1 hypothetical protein [Clostridia bacterium]